MLPLLSGALRALRGRVFIGTHLTSLGAYTVRQKGRTVSYRSHGTGEHVSKRYDGWSYNKFRIIGEKAVIEETAFVWNPHMIEIGAETYIANRCSLKGYPFGSYVSIRIGKECWIGEGTYVHGAGGVDIHDRVGIGPGVHILTSEHDIGGNGPILDRPLRFKGVTIETGADIGAGACIRPGVRIGKCAQVGIGAVVTHDVEPYAVVVGNPAKFLRFRTKENDDLATAEQLKAAS